MKEDSNKTLKILYWSKRLVFVTIIIYIVVFFVINSSYLSKDNLERFGFTLKKTLTESYADGTQRKISLMNDPNAQEVVYKDGFAILSSGNLSVYNSDLVRFSSHNVGYKQPNLEVTDELILCFDRYGKKLSLYDSFDLVAEKSFNNNIINATIGDNGYVAVITEEYGYKGLVTIYDDDLNEVMQWYSADYYLMYAGFTHRNTLAVVAIKANNENIDTYVISLNYKTGTEKKTVCAENRFPMDSLVKYDSSMEIVTDTDIVTFRNEGINSIYRYGSSKIYTYSQFDEYIAVVSVEDSVKSIYKITVIDSVGNKKFEAVVEGFKDIKYFNGYFFVLGNGKITSFGLEGQEVGVYEVPKDVFRILVFRGSSLLVEPEQITAVNTSELFQYSKQ